ncbi:MAG TPA: xylose isomerase [Elusimicrobia bacterium]|nr:xylose isomerase [Elusimicrobiota bacterium]
MNSSWEKYMKLGIIHFMIYPEVMKGEGPIIETLGKILSDEFFMAVEVTRMKDDNVREQAKKMLEVSHIATAYGAQPVLLVNKLNINSLNDAERVNAVNEVKKCIDEASYLGAKGVAILSGQHPGADKEKEAVEQLKKSLRELCGYAKKYNLNFELESFDFDIDKKCLVGKSDLAAEIAKEIRKDYDNFGLILDLSHFPIQYEATKTALKNCAKYLTHLHIGNCAMKDKSHSAYGDQHPRFGISGGENDVKELKEFFEVLFDIGFLKEVKDESQLPIISFEVKPLAGESSELVMANAKRVMKLAWAAIAG